MRKILLALSMLAAGLADTSAQSLYDPAVLQEIKITFYQSNWDYKLDSLKAIDNGTYLLAASVEINGQVFDSVGVKYKGNSSYNANNNKNPMHIELDFVRPDQNYQGIKDIKLSNGFADPTFIREPLSYEILRKYTDAPRANHAKLWINGVYWGVYGNTESISKTFIRSHFKTDGKNPFFKCNPEDIGGPGSSNFPDLVYSSADSSAYYNKYDKQSDYGWKELLALMETLKNQPGNVSTILDVDRALWMLAFNDVLVNLDSYTGAFGQNYYLYYDRNNRWMPLSWDLNMSFGGFPLLTTGNMLSIAQMKLLDPLAQSNNSNRPLIKQLLANPTYKRMYIAHMRTILKDNFSDDSYKQRALALQAVIDAAVQADTKKFYTYSSFKNNITQTAVGGFGNTPGITELMGERYNFLTANTNFTAVPPTISNVNASIGTEVKVTAMVQNATYVIAGWRADTADIFQKVVLLDDGQHNDGAAADGVYGGTFPQLDARMQYYIYAENNTAGIFSPERAEHEFYIVKPVIPQTGNLVINELLADNVSGVVDEAGEPEDWVELYNNSTNPILLTGLYLSDNALKRDKWAFPVGTTIPAQGFVTVWLDNDVAQGPLHANFRLAAASEYFVLSDGGDQIIDSLSFGPQLPDVSYGRYPNGTGPFAFMPTTYNTFNVLTIATNEPGSVNEVLVFPNPVSDVLNIRGKNNLPRIRVLNALGQMVAEWQPDNSTDAAISVQGWPNGLYFLQIGEQALRVEVQR